MPDKIRKELSYRSKENRNRMLELLIKAGDKGLTQQNLANKLDLQRDTIRVHLNSLLEVGVVKRYSAKGKYYIHPEYSSNNISPKYLRNYITEGLLLNSEFLKIFGKDKLLFHHGGIVNKNQRNTPNGKEAYLNVKEITGRIDASNSILKYIQPKFDKNSQLENIIFEMVNQIGAYFVFVYINTFEQYHDNIDTNAPLSNNGEEWLNYALGKYIVEMYFKFIKILQNYKPNENEISITKDFIKNENLKQTSSIERSILYWGAFIHLYPLFYDTLKLKMQELDEEIKFRKEIANKTIFTKTARNSTKGFMAKRKDQ